MEPFGLYDYERREHWSLRPRGRNRGNGNRPKHLPVRLLAPHRPEHLPVRLLAPDPARMPMCSLWSFCLESLWFPRAFFGERFPSTSSFAAAMAGNQYLPPAAGRRRQQQGAASSSSRHAKLSFNSFNFMAIVSILKYILHVFIYVWQ